MNTENPLPSPEFKAECVEKYNTLQDNTEINDPERQMRFAKLSFPAEHIDFLMNHLKLSSIVELNQVSLYILKQLIHIENDEYKFAIYKTTVIDGSPKMTDIYGMDIKTMVRDIISKLNLPPSNS